MTSVSYDRWFRSNKTLQLSCEITSLFSWYKEKLYEAYSTNLIRWIECRPRYIYKSDYSLFYYEWMIIGSHNYQLHATGTRYYEYIISLVIHNIYRYYE